METSSLTAMQVNSLNTFSGIHCINSSALVARFSLSTFNSLAQMHRRSDFTSGCSLYNTKQLIHSHSLLFSSLQNIRLECRWKNWFQRIFVRPLGNITWWHRGQVEVGVQYVSAKWSGIFSLFYSLPVVSVSFSSYLSLSLSFSLTHRYDLDRDGFISKEEMLEIVTVSWHVWHLITVRFTYRALLSLSLSRRSIKWLDQQLICPKMSQHPKREQKKYSVRWTKIKMTSYRSMNS